MSGDESLFGELVPRSRFETQHLVSVSAAAGDLTGCSRRADCGAWGSGIMLFEGRESGSYSATTVVTAVGCNACAEVYVQSRDVGIHAGRSEDEIGTSRAAEIEVEIGLALPKVADVVQKIISR